MPNGSWSTAADHPAKPVFGFYTAEKRDRRIFPEELAEWSVVLSFGLDGYRMLS